MCVGVNSGLASIKICGSFTIFGKNIIDSSNKVIIMVSPIISFVEK